MKHLKKIDDFKLNEDVFGVDLTTPILLAATWLSLHHQGISTMAMPKKMMSNFLKFVNDLGYPIDVDVVEYKFDEIIDKAKSLLDKTKDISGNVDAEDV